MTADASVINESPAAEPAEPVATAPRQTRSVPKPPITRKHVDDAGRIAVAAIAGSARAIAASARGGGRAVAQLRGTIRAVPPTMRALSFFGVAAMLGIVGSIGLTGTAALICSVVVIPVCCIAVGVLGHRWYSGPGPDRTQTQRPSTLAPEADLSQSVAYIDKKLTLALNTFGSERHQQGVIALFQAKTAAELALGTDGTADISVAEPEDYRIRPRIQPGSASLAAS
ncbi:hypothetical protein A5757_18655 [Mycobacterium sp. 852013-51886_SCH5428379]|nr:hypothetical protein A5757_18655 [Mycobacterium sp. 852013-51886_SCH5428379]